MYGDRIRPMPGTMSTGGKAMHSSSKKQPPPTKPKPIMTARKVFADVCVPLNDKEKENQDPLEVYCRIRPLNDMTDFVCIKKASDSVLRLCSPNGGRPDAFYSFKQVFDQNTDQQTVFSKVCLPMVKDVLNGKNGLLFTYGITSSGKTHTLIGKADFPGLLPRTLDTIFNSISENKSRKHSFKPDGQNGFTIQHPTEAILQMQKDREQPKSTPSTPYVNPRTVRQRKHDANELKEWSKRDQENSKVQLRNQKNLYSIFISFIEVYNNYVYDLLDDSMFEQVRTQQQAPSKKVREDLNKKVYIANCTEVEVTSSEDAIDVLLRGLRRRKQAHTALNTESSRSHSVFNIRVVQSPMDDEGEVSQNSNIVHVSQLSLVDLAGSERTTRTGTRGERLREAGNINNSLMTLRNCLDILRDNQKTGAKTPIPYRENKLTHLFKTYFEGEGQVRMIICINASADEYDESIHVLKFAETSQEVMITRGEEFVYRPPSSSTQTMTKLNLPPTIQFASLGNFGPEPPISVLSDLNNERVIPEWLEYLNDHERIRVEKTEELMRNQIIFREHLANMEKEYCWQKNQLSVLQNDIDARVQQVRQLEEQLAHIQRGKESAERKAVSLEKHIKSLERELHELKSSNTLKNDEKEQLKKLYMEALRREAARMKDKYEEKLREKEKELTQQNCLNQEKLHLVHEILYRNNDATDLRSYHESLGFRLPSSPLASGTNSSSTAPKASSTPTRSQKRATRTVSQDRSNGDGLSSPTNAPPTINPRHRRSLSTGNEKFLDHRPPDTLDLGTVFQPKIKNKRSFSNLKDVTADVIKSHDHYALTHHTADETGEVETRVFKGEIIKTIGGGASVIFKDVETLIQEDPLSPSHVTRKRAVSDSQVALPLTPSTIESDANATVATKRSRR